MTDTQKILQKQIELINEELRQFFKNKGIDEMLVKAGKRSEKSRMPAFFKKSRNGKYFALEASRSIKIIKKIDKSIRLNYLTALATRMRKEATRIIRQESLKENNTASKKQNPEVKLTPVYYHVKEYFDPAKKGLFDLYFYKRKRKIKGFGTKSIKYLLDKGVIIGKKNDETDCFFVLNDNKPLSVPKTVYDAVFFDKKTDTIKDNKKEVPVEILEKGKTVKDYSVNSVNPINSVNILTKAYPTQFQLNKAIEKLIEQKGDNASDYSEEEKIFIAKFSGYGGLFSEITEEHKDDFIKNPERYNTEFYTPEKVIAKMVGLAKKYGYNDYESVLEPAAGTGRFLKYFPPQTPVTTYEINKTSHTICKILYPDAVHNLASFETLFMTGTKGRASKKNKIDGLTKYSLVIGNPPYGTYKSKYANYGEKDYTKAAAWDEYFITRGLDLLKPGGLLIYLIGAELSNGGTMFLDRKPRPVTYSIMQKAEFIEAYRLPQGIFGNTDVLTDIVIFKKR